MFRNGWTSGEDLFLGSIECLNHRLNETEKMRNVTYDGAAAELNITPNLTIYEYIDYSLLAIDATTLQTTCNANLRTCIWKQTIDANKKDGQEFSVYYTSGADEMYGCSYAWPDACGASIGNLIASGDNGTFLLVEGIVGWNSTNLTGVENCHDEIWVVGWGGVGYQQSDSECDKYPASYLGPGLWQDTNLCGP